MVGEVGAEHRRRSDRVLCGFGDANSTARCWGLATCPRRQVFGAGNLWRARAGPQRIGRIADGLKREPMR